MHQDLLSEKFCGEGIPSWAVNTASLNGTKAFPIPLEKTAFTDVASDGFPT
eukprot:gene45397-56547_t